MWPPPKRKSLPSRYANRAGSRFKFLLPLVGQSPKGDARLDVVLRFVDTKLGIEGWMPGRYLDALAIAHLPLGKEERLPMLLALVTF